MSKLRIGKVSLQEFRCFHEATIDLSADVVAIYGRNGVGKTAIFDAIEFALFGSIMRLDEGAPADFDYISRIGTDRATNVDLELVSDTEPIHIETSWDSSQREVSIGGSKQWRSHRDLLYELLVDQGSVLPRREVKAVRDLFQSSLMLSQYSIRAFVEPSSPEERAKILANLAGLARVQRSKDKAEQVIALAERRRGKIEGELRGVQPTLKEAKGQLAELEGRGREIEERLAGERPTGKDLLEALHRAGMDEYLSVPTGESDAVLSRAIQSRCDERATGLDRQSEQLSLLESGFQSYVDRVERIGRLALNETELRASLRDLTDFHEKILGSKQAAADRVSAMEAEANNLAEDLKRWQRLSELISRLTDLDREFDAIDSTFRAENSTFQNDQKDLEQKRRNREVLSETLKSARLAGERVRRAHTTLETLQNDLPGYVSTLTELKDVERKVAESKKQLAALDARAAQSTTQLTELRAKVQQAEADTRRAELAFEEQNALLSRVRSLVSDRNCPLCGAEYDTRDELLAVIDKTLASVPQVTKSLMAQYQTLKTELTAGESESETRERARRTLNGEISRLENEQGRLRAGAAAFEERVLELKLEAREEDIRKKLSQVRQDLQRLEKKEQDALDKLEQEDDAIRFEEARLSNAKNSLEAKRRAHHRIRNELDRNTLAVSEMGYTKGSLPDAEEVGKAIDESAKKLAAAERKKASVESERNRADQEEKENARHRREASERLNELEKELATLRSTTKSFEGDCERLEVEPTRKALETARNTLDSHVRKVANVKRVAEKLELAGSLDALKTERTAVEKAIEKTLSEVAELESQVKHLANAIQAAQSWIPSLAGQLETVVERTLRRHQLEIGRHFKAMIPSPHLFDEILLRHVDGRLEIGVQYRHQSVDSGEPFFYLSNAQLNVLALSIFLSLGAKQQWSNLDSLLLDDPVQHLDDLDAVSFLDTIRAVALGRFGKRRQVILSTCDRNLYGLMVKKFRLLEAAGLTFNAVSLSERGLQGPSVRYDTDGSDRAAGPLSA